MCGVSLAQQQVDKFTQQEKPEKSNSVAKVKLIGTTVTDVLYASVGDHQLLLDLYLPRQPAGSPLLVWIHGGGWYQNNKSKVFLSWLSNYGITVASINYRLVDIAKWPAQLHDCKGAVRWLRANARQYGYDAERIVVAGASAGGHLAALMGTTGDVVELEGDVGGNLHYSSRVQAVVDYYGATDFVLRSKTQPSRANKKGSVVYNLLGGAADELTEVARQASARYHVTSDDPPFLVFHGKKDKTVLIDQSEAIDKAYKEAGLPLTFHRIAKGAHGGFVFYSGRNAKRLYLFVKQHVSTE
ncbi:MAG: lipase [Planctomycetaceae bacterium]|nr:lipase [Planctomycetaceae bacterium]